EAELDYTVTLDPCTNEVDIVILINEGRSGKIKRIEFCGFEPCEEEEILTKLVTKEYVWWKSWMTEEGVYREDAMQHDQFQVVQYLQNRGYADAKVQILVEEVACDRIVVKILADRGELYTVSRIKFTGNCIFS
ncbi:MAG: POTRA domain-containing protein, partial [Parachlamydiaceae bacterium]